MQQWAVVTFVLLCALNSILLWPQQVAPARREVYIVPFSHLDLFWAGTQEEGLSRGNRIISKAIELAERYPNFRFLVEDDDFVADYVDGHRGSPELAGEVPSSWANLTTSLSPLWPPVITATDTLLSAEKFAAINYALRYSQYPGVEFEAMWKDALKSMDHNNDGQGGEIGDERKLGYAQEVSLRAGQILRDSLRNIAERVQHPFPRSTPIVVFNPLSWTRDDKVKTHVTLFGDIESNDIADYKKGMRLVDEKGTAIPFQVEEVSEWFSRALDMVFVARSVPALGYKTYYLVPRDKSAVFPNACQTKMENDGNLNVSSRIMGSDVMENEYYRVSVDRATGRVSIWDKELNRMVANDIEIAASEERGGDDLSIISPTGRTIVNIINNVELDENGPVQTVMRVTGEVAGVPIVQRLTLCQGIKRVDIEDRVDWKPGRSMNIEQVFPLPQEKVEVRNGTPFGSVAAMDMMPNAGPRNNDEIPRDIWKRWRQIQDWVFAGTREWGFTVSVDHQFLTVGDSALRAGMLRGTRFSPVNVVRGGRPYQNLWPPPSEYIFHYSFTSGRGDWAAAKSWRSGMALNTPLIPVVSANELSQKSLPPARSFCSLDADNLVVTALKKADKDEAIVLRVFEIRGDSAETPVQFLGHARRFLPANLLEEADPKQERDLLRVGPYEISTVKLRPTP